LQIEGFDLEQQKHRVLFRSSHGPQKTTVHPGRMERDGGGDEPGRGPNSESQRGEGDAQDPGNDSRRSGAHGDEGNREVTSTQCVSCHAVSSNGKHIAVFSQTAEEAPPEFDAPNGFLTVLSMPERKVVIQLPHAFMPQFNPQNPDLLAFGEVDETIGVKDQMMVRKSDIHVLDLTTGKHFPLPGADLKDRVENLPYWSPDGKRLLFIRTQPGQMWHGAAGHLDVASIPFNNGKGGLAEPLKGASSNGRSNFLPVYSPDGRWVVFTQADQGFFSQESSDLWIVPAAGGTARRMNCNSSHTESWHRFSPDGKWLAMVTNREDIRRPHIYISRFDSETGECKPAVQMPFVSGPGAHTHAFSWTPRFDWLTDYEQVSQN
jgi:Tol biopolymer transport system component